MDRKLRLLLIIFLVVTAFSVGTSFYRYIILEDIVFYTDEELFQQSLLEE